MFLERPVARLSAALEATKPSSSAAAATRARVVADTEPRPDSAREAVDFDTFASFATSAKVLIRVRLQLSCCRGFSEYVRPHIVSCACARVADAPIAQRANTLRYGWGSDMRNALFRCRLVRRGYRRWQRVSALLRDRFQQALFQRGFVLVPATTVTEIEMVFDALRPLDVGVPLIRVGGRLDGGYLLPDDLDGITSLISPGVGHSSNFEEYFAKLGISCQLIDASVDGPPTWHENFSFARLFVGPRTEGNLVSLGDLLRARLDAEGDALLQMDVEGAEWDVLEATSSGVLSCFRMIVVELHNLGDRLSQPSSCAATLRLIERLNQIFYIVHFHPNNYGRNFKYSGRELPNVVEITLLRKDRARAVAKRATVPHPLDCENAGKTREPSKFPDWWN